MLERVGFAADTVVLPYPKRPTRGVVSDLHAVYGGNVDVLEGPFYSSGRGSLYSPYNHLQAEIRGRQTKAQLIPGANAGRVLLSLQAYAEATVLRYPNLDRRRRLGLNLLAFTDDPPEESDETVRPITIPDVRFSHEISGAHDRGLPVRSFLFTLGVGAAALMHDADPIGAHESIASAAGFSSWEALFNEWNAAVAMPPREAAQYLLSLPTPEV